MLRRTGAIALGAAIGAIAAPAVASAATKTVYAGDVPGAGKLAAQLVPNAGAFVAKYQPSANAFFLRRVTINAGGKVKFLIEGFHTIDLPGSSGKPVPLISPTGSLDTGEKDATGADFWFDGHLPQQGFTKSLLAPSGGKTYNGKTRVDTGLPLGPPKPFVVKFSKAGTYKYFCDVHPGMIGYVVVKPKGKKVPTAKQDKAALVRQLKAEFKSAIAASKTKIPADTISLGLTKPGIELFNMFPATLNVAVGTTVTFAMSKNTYEVHTATFGPAKYVGALAKKFGNSVVLPGQALFPSDPTSPLVVTKTSHGNGFVNTGALDQNAATAALPSSATIKFNQAGTYHFSCLVHSFMHGTIVVK